MTADVDHRAMRCGASSLQRIMRLASGLLVIFFAFGFGSWFSGAASWVGFYLGARGRRLIAVAQVTTWAGFVLGVVMTLAWYWRRCRRGEADISPWAALTACLALPIGSVFWAIFVDAIAYHYGQDIVRPAFDYAIMYIVLGGVLPLTIGVPWLVSRLRRGAPSAGVVA
jgi:hypothetical protein